MDVKVTKEKKISIPIILKLIIIIKLQNNSYYSSVYNCDLLPSHYASCYIPVLNIRQIFNYVNIVNKILRKKCPNTILCRYSQIHNTL